MNCDECEKRDECPIGSRCGWEFPGDWTEGERVRGWKLGLPAIDGEFLSPETVEEIEVELNAALQLIMAFKYQGFIEEEGAKARREKLN